MTKEHYLKDFNKQLDNFCVDIGKMKQRLIDERELLEGNTRTFYNEGDQTDSLNTTEIDQKEGKLAAVLIAIQSVRDSTIKLLVVNPLSSVEELHR
jgi:hypothetical protein